MVFHLIVVLGISFVMPTGDDRVVIGPPLRITLVSNISENAPEDTEILAQANSDGTKDSNADIANQLLNNEIEQSLRKQTPLPDADQFIDTPTADQSPLKKTQNAQDQIGDAQDISREQLAENINLAYLNAQALPREKYVSARAKESKYAAYIEKWRLLVERVGNLNYPEAARAQKLEGALVLDAAINADGSISKVRVLKSSGHKVLDDAAERIVLIASPFDRFPDAIASELDILHIVRTWEFSQNQVTSKNLGQ